MSEPVALFVLGLVVLNAGAELFARGLGWVARSFGTGQSADRVVVAAVGLTAPVLAVCLALALSGYPRAALATALGANLANVGLVLGLAALVRPLAGQSSVIRPGIVLLIASSLLVWFLVRDQHLTRPAGFILLAVGAVAVVALVRFARVEKSTTPGGAAFGVGGLGGVLLILGIAATLGGAALTPRSLAGFVAGAGGGTAFALIGLAPAIAIRGAAAAVISARRGESDAVLGGAVGASVLNLLLVLGVVAIAVPIPVPERLVMNELPAQALAAALLLPVLAAGLKLPRWEGAILLAAYAGFVAWELKML